MHADKVNRAMQHEFHYTVLYFSGLQEKLVKIKLQYILSPPIVILYRLGVHILFSERLNFSIIVCMPVLLRVTITTDMLLTTTKLSLSFLPFITAAHCLVREFTNIHFLLWLYDRSNPSNNHLSALFSYISKAFSTVFNRRLPKYLSTFSLPVGVFCW